MFMIADYVLFQPMESDCAIEVLLACTLVAAAWWLVENTSTRYGTRKHFGKLFLYREQDTHGAYHNLLPQLRRDLEMHFVYIQMSAERLEKLLRMVAPKLMKYSWITPLSPGEGLPDTQIFVTWDVHDIINLRITGV